MRRAVGLGVTLSGKSGTDLRAEESVETDDVRVVFISLLPCHIRVGKDAI